jgi:sugar lactone lactonase YvrE
MRAELALDSRCELGEGIIWDAERAVLWFTDIDGRQIWRFDPASNTSERFAPPDRVGFLAVASGGRLLVGAAKALYMAVPGSAGVLSFEKLVDLEPDLPTTRANDAKADRSGNVVFGTLDEQKPRQPLGRFYQYSTRHGLRPLDLPRCRVSNSICFSPDGGTMYFTDTPTGVIRRADYDPEAATVTSVRDFVRIDPGDGHPDGSTVDADGCLWNAVWGGAALRRFRPEGTLDVTIEVPTNNPTCPAFGGSGLGTLYVTSSRQQHTAQELARAPHAGGVFAIRIPGVDGILDTPFD